MSDPKGPHPDPGWGPFCFLPKTLLLLSLQLVQTHVIIILLIQRPHVLIHNKGVGDGAGDVEHGTGHVDDGVDGQDGADHGELGAHADTGEAHGGGHGGGAGDAGDTQGADGNHEDGHNDHGDVNGGAGDVANIDDQQGGEDTGAALHAGGGAEASHEAGGTLVDAQLLGQGLDGHGQAADAGTGGEGQQHGGEGLLHVDHGVEAVDRQQSQLDDELDNGGQIEGQDELAHLQDGGETALGDGVGQQGHNSPGHVVQDQQRHVDHALVEGVDEVIQGLGGLLALVLDPPDGETQEGGEDDQADDVAVHHGPHDVVGDQVADGGGDGGDILGGGTLGDDGATLANAQQQADDDAGDGGEGDHSHGDDEGLFHQLAHGLALAHVDDHLEDGEHHQGNDDHLDEADVAVTEQVVPGGGLGDKGGLHGGVGEAGDELHHQAQHQAQAGADHDHHGEVHVLLVVQDVDEIEQRHQDDQEDDGPDVTDHQEVFKKYTLHTLTSFFYYLF